MDEGGLKTNFTPTAGGGIIGLLLAGNILLGY